MSREAWGDEGSNAMHWEDTLLRSELDKVVIAFEKWARGYGSEMPNPDFVDAVRHIGEGFDALQETLTGKI